MERNVRRHECSEEGGALRGNFDNLGPCPRGIFEPQTNVRVAGAGAHEISDGLHRRIFPGRLVRAPACVPTR